jgi:hypothetical protein
LTANLILVVTLSPQTKVTELQPTNCNLIPRSTPLDLDVSKPSTSLFTANGLSEKQMTSPLKPTPDMILNTIGPTREFSEKQMTSPLSRQDTDKENKEPLTCVVTNHTTANNTKNSNTSNTQCTPVLKSHIPVIIRTSNVTPSKILVNSNVNSPKPSQHLKPQYFARVTKSALKL